MFSLGCIFAEMLKRKPLFMVRDYYQHLQMMIEKLGPIPEKFLNSNKAFKDHYKNLMKEREGMPQKTLFDQFPNSS